jgi:uncharacterized membrane protein YphA (DoxX/SURF4 family)
MTVTKNQKLASWLLRIGLASVYLYAGGSALMDPGAWLGYLPSWTGHFIAPTLALMIFSLFQVALAIWLLSGWMVRYAAILAALAMAGILVLNLSSFIVTFRDIAIVFMALALAVNP